MNDVIKGNILTPDGWVHGAISFGERNGDDYILPGFIDLHVHGGAGRDMMEGGDAPHVIARLHAKHGTTSLLATTMTAPPKTSTGAGRHRRACASAARTRRASSACTWKAPTSTRASWARSRRSRAKPRWMK
jgi:N-acetylglucosamine-6-phosphate deacetylase